MLDASIKAIAIVGPGLLGGSIGLGLRKRGWRGRLVGVARKQTTLDAAIKRGCIDAGVSDLAKACADADMVILCTPVNTVRKQLAELAGIVREGAIVTDVGSTKRSIVADAPRKLRFVGSHPMAGSELTGPEAADADLYVDKPVIVTPTDKTDAGALKIVEGLWTTLGMRVHRMDAAEHDRAVAMVSHLPHVLSVLMMETAAPGSPAPGSKGMEIASTGLYDVTRLAGGDVAMWTDILMDNGPRVLEAMDAWRGKFDALREAINKNDRKRIEKILTEAREQRAKWLGRFENPSPPGGGEVG